MLRVASRLLVGVLAGIGVLSVAAAIWLVSGGMSSRRNPGSVESWVAVRMRSVAIPASERTMADPAPPGPLSLKSGFEQFADQCATCHGVDGSGQAEIGRGLYPRPPDLRGATTQAMTDGEMFHVINQGVRFTGMPAWDKAPAQAWALVYFIRRLPQLSSAELDRMKTSGARAVKK